jgi:hypothetical protein
MIQSEYNKSLELGISCEYLGPDKLKEEFPPSLGVQNAVNFPNQAQFNSYKYCVGLVDRIAGADCDVFENTRVTAVHQHLLSPHVIECADNDSSVTAEHVVLATHLPIVDRSLHFSILEPSRSHCIAVRIRGHKMKNMSINVDMPMRSLRMTGENNDVLVVSVFSNAISVHVDLSIKWRRNCSTTTNSCYYLVPTLVRITCNCAVLQISGNSIKQGDAADIEALYRDLESWARTHFDGKLCQCSEEDMMRFRCRLVMVLQEYMLPAFFLPAALISFFYCACSDGGGDALVGDGLHERGPCALHGLPLQRHQLHLHRHR